MIDKEKYLTKFETLIEKAENETKLYELKNIFLKTEISPLYQQLRTIDDKPKFGQILNSLKNDIELIFEKKLLGFNNSQHNKEKINDLSLVSNNLSNGSRHILNLVIEEIISFFKQFGFEILNGNEVVSVDYNFTALNIPDNHPARNKSDSFFLDNNLMLRTHCTANTAIKINKNKNSDIRIISYGNVYRKDDDDATHSHQFMQLDIVWIKENLTVSNLKWIIDKFLKYLFTDKTKTRYRLSYFPFTEPSFEVDVSCFNCNQKGCNICKHTGWIEILGAGMLNLNVLDYAGNNIKTGLAAGIGIERIAMLKYGINDIRDFYSNDLNLLEQFKKIM